MRVQVRAAVATDARQICELMGELGYPLEPGDVERERRERGMQVLVAENRGDVLGLLVLHTRRHFQLAALVASIDVLVVNAAHRRKGVGSALTGAAVDLAERAGATLIDVNSGIERIEARRFYEALGFDVVSHHLRRRITAP